MPENNRKCHEVNVINSNKIKPATDAYTPGARPKETEVHVPEYLIRVKEIL